jgi:hypothetical protein
MQSTLATAAAKFTFYKELEKALQEAFCKETQCDLPVLHLGSFATK